MKRREFLMGAAASLAPPWRFTAPPGRELNGHEATRGVYNDRRHS